MFYFCALFFIFFFHISIKTSSNFISITMECIHPISSLYIIKYPYIFADASNPCDTSIHPLSALLLTNAGITSVKSVGRSNAFLAFTFYGMGIKLPLWKLNLLLASLNVFLNLVVLEEQH